MVVLQDHLKEKFSSILTPLWRDHCHIGQLVTNYYQQCPGSGKQLILDYVTFFEERKMVGAPWTTFNVMTMQ